MCNWKRPKKQKEVGIVQNKNLEPIKNIAIALDSPLKNFQIANQNKIGILS